MQNIVNMMRGSVRVEVQGAYPERFMNICAENDIQFWNLERIDELTVRVTMHIGGYNKMRPLLGNVMCTAKVLKKDGAPFFVWRIRKRYALIVGFIAVIVLTWIMSLYIWDITVTGNDKVTASEILEALENVGVGIGTYSPSIDSEALRNEVLLELKDISWITIQVNGSKATVVVRERTKLPDMKDDETPTSITAGKSGIIKEMIVFNGEAVRAVGDSVSEGDDIVSGIMNSLSSGSRIVAADAEVYARTWYQFSAQMPLETSKKEYTGDTNKKISIFFGGNRINLYLNGGISYSECDKMIEENFLTLPGGIILPIKLVVSTYTEYEKATYTLSNDQAVELLKEQLMTRLEDSIDGEITDTSFDLLEKDGIMTVTLNAECYEQIGITRNLTEEEMNDNTEERDNAVND